MKLEWAVFPEYTRPGWGHINVIARVRLGHAGLDLAYWLARPPGPCEAVVSVLGLGMTECAYESFKNTVLISDSPQLSWMYTPLIVKVNFDRGYLMLGSN